jgi:hypothetical protein
MAGQIIKRGENTWLVRVYLGRGADGKRQYQNKTIRGVKKDAQTWLNATLGNKDRGIPTFETKVTLGNISANGWKPLPRLALAKEPLMDMRLCSNTPRMKLETFAWRRFVPETCSDSTALFHLRPLAMSMRL